MLKRVIFISIIFMILCLDRTCFSEEIVSSRIKEVVLFSNQALVKREGSCKVKKGLNDLFLEIEPFNLDKDSVSAKVYGEGSLYSVQFKEIYLRKPVQEEIRNLRERIKNLEEDKKSMLDQLRVLDAQERFLNSVVEFSQVQIPKDLTTTFPKIEDLEEMLKFLEENMKAINQEKARLRKEIGDLEEEMEVLKKELTTLEEPSQKTRKVIEIVFFSEKEQMIKVEASYIVYNSGWQAFYKVDVPLSLEEVNLMMFAKIKQKSGEDWSKVKLSISNAIPLKGIDLPTPSSWYLDIIRRKEKRGILLRAELEKARTERVSWEQEPNIPPADFTYALKKEMPLSFEYQLPQSLSIKSKEKETLLPLFSKRLEGEFFYYIFPRLSPLSFLICQVSPDEELLPGPLNVYFGGRFVGRTYLPEKRAGEEFYLNLGVDRGVRVKWEKIKDKRTETFFGKIKRKTVIRDLAFKINIENLKEKPIVVKVIDTIPVSRTDRIEVKNVKIVPLPKEKNYQGKEGVNLWELQIKAKRKAEINIEFTITYPENEPISGL